MNTDHYKETTPVIFGKKGVKHLRFSVEEPGYICFSVHWHNRMELLRVQSGMLKVQIGDVSLQLEPNQLAIINPGQLHTGFCLTPHTTYDVLMFDLNDFRNNTAATRQYLDPVLEGHVVFQNRTDQSDVLLATTELLQLLQDESQHPLMTVGQVYRLFGMLYRHCAVEQGYFHAPDPRFEQVLTFINTHYTEPISSGLLSRQFSYSEAYFCRLFKRMTGLTLSEYLRILRLEYAQQLLKQPQLSVADIADRCGFTDTAYFCHCFRRQFSQTPTSFRQRLLNT